MNKLRIGVAIAAVAGVVGMAVAEPTNERPAPVMAAVAAPPKADGKALKAWLATADAKASPDLACAALAVLWTQDATAARKIYRGDAAFWTGAQRKIADAKGLLPGASLGQEDLARIGDVVLPRFDKTVRADRLDEALPAAPFVTLYSRHMCRLGDCARSRKTFQAVDEAVARATKAKGASVAAAGVGTPPTKKAPSNPPSAFDLGGGCDPDCP